MRLAAIASWKEKQVWKMRWIQAVDAKQSRETVKPENVRSITIRNVKQIKSQTQVQVPANVMKPAVEAFPNAKRQKNALCQKTEGIFV